MKTLLTTLYAILIATGAATAQTTGPAASQPSAQTAATQAEQIKVALLNARFAQKQSRIGVRALKAKLNAMDNRNSPNAAQLKAAIAQQEAVIAQQEKQIELLEHQQKLAGVTAAK